MEKQVIRTFFFNNWMAPCFELEDGTIMIPIGTSSGATWISIEDAQINYNMKHSDLEQLKLSTKKYKIKPSFQPTDGHG